MRNISAIILIAFIAKGHAKDWPLEQADLENTTLATGRAGPFRRAIATGHLLNQGHALSALCAFHPARIAHQAHTIHLVHRHAEPEGRQFDNEPSSGPIEAVNMKALPDFETDGVWLSEMIAKWLDEEWTELAVHKAIGNHVQERYVAARNDGVTDVGELLLLVGTSLEGFDMGSGEESAFINAWDVANKVSDLMFIRMDRELCTCAGSFGRDEESAKQGRRDENVESKVLSREVGDADEQPGRRLRELATESSKKPGLAETRPPLASRLLTFCSKCSCQFVHKWPEIKGGKPARVDLFAQRLPDATSIFALIGLFAGSGATFAMFRSRRSSATTKKELLLGQGLL